MNSLVKLFDAEFDTIHQRSFDLVKTLPEDRLFWKPAADGGEPYSPGELLIRSAAAVEQTFGGITRRLWDDPFEWSLPEELADRERLAEYILEVNNARVNGFSFFVGDQDLLRQIPAPDTLKPIAAVLLETIARASHMQGRAYGVAQQFIRLRPRLA